MAQRCPAARSLGPALLLDHRYRFAHHADVVIDRGSDVHGVLWKITEDCLKSLDRLEGYPYYYDRKWAPVQQQSGDTWALVYFMQPGVREAPPSTSYYNMVMEGFQEHQVPTDQISRALTNAYNVYEQEEFNEYTQRYLD